MLNCLSHHSPSFQAMVYWVISNTIKKRSASFSSYFILLWTCIHYVLSLYYKAFLFGCFINERKWRRRSPYLSTSSSTNNCTLRMSSQGWQVVLQCTCLPRAHPFDRRFIFIIYLFYLESTRNHCCVVLSLIVNHHDCPRRKHYLRVIVQESVSPHRKQCRTEVMKCVPTADHH